MLLVPAMNPILIAITGAIFALTLSLITGCTPAGPTGPDPISGPDPLSSAPPPLPGGLNEASPHVAVKPSYDRALQLSEGVTVGQQQDRIEAMFGRPDKAGFETYGAQTDSPWKALVWEWVFTDVDPPRALSIVFQEVQGVWLVNHGDWPE